jgi:hypothetical protein
VNTTKREEALLLIREMPSGQQENAIERLAQRTGDHVRTIEREVNAPQVELATIKADRQGLFADNALLRKRDRQVAPMSDEAYVGIAGDVVRAIEPHTEADPVALLVTLLTYVGNLIGRGPHVLVDGAHHSGRLFSLLTGKSSRSRKGTSERHIRSLLELVEPEWTHRVVSGLSSGEGLVYHVRDAVTVDGKLIDEGIADKRLMVVETEFASVLRRMNWRGSTLSTELRAAWDGGTLQTLTKNSPVRATGAHISVLAHVTARELRHELTDTEAANGFANRFLIHHVSRSQFLPRGGRMDTVNRVPLIRDLRASVEFARSIDRLEWGESGAMLWDGVYADLTADLPGLVGALTARVEAHAIRLAVLYALLDRSNRIEPRHLKPALAIVDHAVGSVRHIFADATGNTLANRILAHLDKAPGGELKQSELYRKLGAHTDSGLIEDANELLQSLGRARVEFRDTGGRPAKWVSKT